MAIVVRLFTIISFLLFSGCYLRSSLKALSPPNKEITNPLDPSLSESHEFVPGAQKTYSTVRSYQVDSVIGHHQPDLLKTSLSRSYKVYSTAEGQIISSGK